MRRYVPPSLDRRVRIVDPNDGNCIASVWAHKFDRRSYIAYAEDVSAEQVLTTDWTIRGTAGQLSSGHPIPPGIEIHETDGPCDDTNSPVVRRYVSIGPPQERGATGRNTGFLLFTTELIQ